MTLTNSNQQHHTCFFSRKPLSNMASKGSLLADNLAEATRIDPQIPMAITKAPPVLLPTLVLSAAVATSMQWNSNRNIWCVLCASHQFRWRISVYDTVEAEISVQYFDVETFSTRTNLISASQVALYKSLVKWVSRPLLETNLSTDHNS